MHLHVLLSFHKFVKGRTRNELIHVLICLNSVHSVYVLCMYFSCRGKLDRWLNLISVQNVILVAVSLDLLIITFLLLIDLQVIQCEYNEQYNHTNKSYSMSKMSIILWQISHKMWVQWALHSDQYLIQYEYNEHYIQTNMSYSVVTMSSTQTSKSYNVSTMISTHRQDKQVYLLSCCSQPVLAWW